MRDVIFAVLSIIVILVLANFAIGATFETSAAAASVTVNTFVDITLTDRGATGLGFGSLDPGTNNNPEAAQDATFGAVNFTVELTTNKNPINVELRGTGFFTSGSNTIDINKLTADDDATVDQASGTETGSAQINLITSFQLLKTLSPGNTQGIWFWLDIPSAQAAGTYTTTIEFRGS